MEIRHQNQESVILIRNRQCFLKHLRERNQIMIGQKNGLLSSGRTSGKDDHCNIFRIAIALIICGSGVLLHHCVP